MWNPGVRGPWASPGWWNPGVPALVGLWGVPGDAEPWHSSPNSCGGGVWQVLGAPGDVGYQTFLYSTEPEIRRLLLFLVEKLPRDEAEDPGHPHGTGGTAGRLGGKSSYEVEYLGQAEYNSMGRGRCGQL